MILDQCSGTLGREKFQRYQICTSTHPFDDSSRRFRWSHQHLVWVQNREVFYCWLWDYIWTIPKIAVKPRRRTSGAQIYCVFQTRGKKRRLRRWFAKNIFQDIDCISSSVNLESESRPRRLFQKIYKSMKPMSGGLCGGCGDYGWTLPDTFQTYFIRWDIIDLPSPQIGAKTLFLVFFYSR